MAAGTLYLLPTGLGGEVLPFLPAGTLAVLQQLEYFVAENPKTARAFLKAAGYPRPLQSLQIETLDEHTPEARHADLLAPVSSGRGCGLLSEAGCPAVADPGSGLIGAAHRLGIRVVPLVGPSALLLALMASGLNGQRFCFHGYLPVERGARARQLSSLEKTAEAAQVTQVFIEAPYRNDALLEAILETCSGDTLLCVATDLTLPSEEIATREVADWKRQRPRLNRRPTVFLLNRPVRHKPQKR
jgi:16S rRNA (cytidine1402-2'-O)-methyltransferase